MDTYMHQAIISPPTIIVIIINASACMYTYLELLQSSSWLAEYQMHSLAPQQDLWFVALALFCLLELDLVHQLHPTLEQARFL